MVQSLDSSQVMMLERQLLARDWETVTKFGHQWAAKFGLSVVYPASLISRQQANLGQEVPYDSLRQRCGQTVGGSGRQHSSGFQRMRSLRAQEPTPAGSKTAVRESYLLVRLKSTVRQGT